MSSSTHTHPSRTSAVRLRASLQTKMLAAFGLVVALMLAVGLFSLGQLGSANQHLHSLAGRVVPSTRVVGEISALMNKYRKDQLHYIVALPAERPASVEGGVQGDLDEDVALMRTALASYRSKGLVEDPKDAYLLASFQADFARYVALTSSWRALADRGLTQRASAVVGAGEGDAAYNKLKDVVAAWNDHKVASAGQVAASSQSSYDRGVALILALLAAAVALALTVAIVLSRRIAKFVTVLTAHAGALNERALASLRGGLDAFAGGNLAVPAEHDVVPMTVSRRDELGALTNIFNDVLATTDSSIASYNEMRDRVAEMLRGIATRSESLAQASRQMSASSEDVASTSKEMAQTCQEMARTSEETGHAVGEIAQAVGDVASGAESQARSLDQARDVTERVAGAAQSSAELARDTASAAGGASDLATKGMAAAERATQAIRGVKSTSSQVSSAMGTLGTKSEQIGGIVETITTIAGQTNLLALNAAIEAARAGEQGRGFAVVAEEVRKLAEESSSAAATISTMIAEVQQETEQAARIVEHAATQTDEGAATVEEAREAFMQIGNSVRDMSERATTIAAAVDEINAFGGQMQKSVTEVATIAEQSSGAAQQVSATTEETSAATEQIAASTQQIAASTQQLACSAQQSAASAQDLAALSQELDELVQRFTLA